jgi:hypothetical protein
MNTDTNADSDLPNLEEIHDSDNFEVWVRIKKDSKYYYQGLVDPTDDSSKARFFKLRRFSPFSKFGLALCRDIHVLHFNGNAYTLDDCELFLVDVSNRRLFLRIL